MNLRIFMCFAMLLCFDAAADDWQAVTEQEVLREAFSNTVMKGSLPGEEQAVAHYRADGTGTLTAWGDTFDRQWKVEDDGRVCVLADRSWICSTIERSSSEPSRYRATRTDTDETVEFTMSEGGGVVASETGTNDGGVAQPSAEELAAKLANPTAPVMTIGNNIDYVRFDGDLPGAADQSSFRYVFQTVFPFKLSNGGSVFFRPAIPVMFNEPIPAGGDGWREVGTLLHAVPEDLLIGRIADREREAVRGAEGRMPGVIPPTLR